MCRFYVDILHYTLPTNIQYTVVCKFIAEKIRFINNNIFEKKKGGIATLACFIRTFSYNENFSLRKNISKINLYSTCKLLKMHKSICVR